MSLKEDCYGRIRSKYRKKVVREQVFFRVEAGIGRAVLNGREYALEDGSVVVVPAGTEHNIINSSKSEPLKLYMIYSPPNHSHGTINKDKAEALAHEKEHHH